MISIISKNKKRIEVLMQSKKVRYAFVFGSACTNRFNENSDVDILIEFQEDVEPLERGELWFELYDALLQIFKRDVDLLTTNQLKNPYFIADINKTKKLIYERKMS